MFPRRLRRGMVLVSQLTAALALVTLLGYWAYTHRLRPVPTTETIAPGLIYHRLCRDTPRPIQIHVLEMNLSHPNLRFLVTPPEREDRLPFRARTTSNFLATYDLVAAINGDLFLPWHANHPFDFYPKAGDPVTTCGPSVSDGRLTLPQEQGYFAWMGCIVTIGPGNELHFGLPNDQPPPQKGRDTPLVPPPVQRPVAQAICGGPFLLRAGKIVAEPEGQKHPQSAIAQDADRRVAYLVVVDGRQPNYSEGVTDHELAEILLELGAADAMKLDGGGSSTLVVRGYDGAPRVLNSPIHCGVPGWERPVANHLGIYLRTSRLPLNER